MKDSFCSLLFFFTCSFLLDYMIHATAIFSYFDWFVPLSLMWLHPGCRMNSCNTCTLDSSTYESVIPGFGKRLFSCSFFQYLKNCVVLSFSVSMQYFIKCILHCLQNIILFHSNKWISWESTCFSQLSKLFLSFHRLFICLSVLWGYFNWSLAKWISDGKNHCNV